MNEESNLPVNIKVPQECAKEFANFLASVDKLIETVNQKLLVNPHPLLDKIHEQWGTLASTIGGMWYNTLSPEEQLEERARIHKEVFMQGMNSVNLAIRSLGR